MKKSGFASVYDEAPVYAVYKTLTNAKLRSAVIRCVISIFYNFFFRQFRAAFLPGRAPVSKVDHPLDLKIPFKPAWVTIYLDFIFFWIRVISFLLRNFGRKAYKACEDFISTMGQLYKFAAGVYKQNFSTTERPFYIKRPRFLLIHLVDPHLMCIPSLHVMIAIRTYTKFRQIVRELGQETSLAVQIEEMRQGALAISRAILYVKQHSINCISAALYAMCCFDPELFTQEEAESFAIELFTGKSLPAMPCKKKPANYAVRPGAVPRGSIKAEDTGEILAHVISLFRKFMSEQNENAYWGQPLLEFLRM